jgi:hypothetical protein
MATVTPIRKPKTKVTVGSLADAMQAEREAKRLLEEQVKVHDAALKVMEVQLIELMDAEGVTKSTGKHASVSISEAVNANVKDWDAFYAWIFKHKYKHMLQLRPAQLACREIFESKGQIPGVEPFIKRTINLRDI